MPVSSGELMRQILDQFHLSQLLQEKVVFKLRDSRGALLPFSANLQSNDSSSPYVLEVVDVHQNIQALEWVSPVQRVSIKDRVNQLGEKISQLEDKMLLFDQECQVKIGEEMQLMASQVNTLERIMKEDDE